MQFDLRPSQSDSVCELKLENFPGGSETFEIILQFCYGLPVNLNPKNVAGLRCAAEFLEMTEAHEDGNLIAKTEAFFTFVVLSSWEDSITALKCCENLAPWAENLQIVRRCCDSIASKACQETSISSGRDNDGQKWWFEDLATLHIGHFMRIVRALRAKGAKPEIIGSCLVYYAAKWLPGMGIVSDGPSRCIFTKHDMLISVPMNKRLEGKTGHSEERMVVESLVSGLPPQKEAVSCKFLLGMLKMALVYSASPALVSELEKRIGMVLENANVNDLLIPNYASVGPTKAINPPNGSTMLNVDIVQRIMEYYIMHEQQQLQLEPKSRKMVSKLLDNYLAEIARDPNLSITKFQVLAETLPDNARACHDGIYRAVDTYLKSHPSLSEHDRRRICKTMNCEKLSLDACLHAAQNDRLPVRIVIQVLFSEQVKMRAAMKSKEQGWVAASGEPSDKEESLLMNQIKLLKAELDEVRASMQLLQRDYTDLQREYESKNHKQQRKSLAWTLNWRKIRASSFLGGGKADGEEEARYSCQRKPSRTSLRRRLSVS